MNAKSLIALTTIILATTLQQPLINAQVPQFAGNSVFNAVNVQHSSLQSNQRLSASPPPVEGAPSDRTPAGSRVHYH